MRMRKGRTAGEGERREKEEGEDIGGRAATAAALDGDGNDDHQNDHNTARDTNLHPQTTS